MTRATVNGHTGCRLLTPGDWHWFRDECGKPLDNQKFGYNFAMVSYQVHFFLVLADESMHGMRNAMETIKNIDHVSPFPFQNYDGNVGNYPLFREYEFIHSLFFLDSSTVYEGHKNATIGGILSHFSWKDYLGVRSLFILLDSIFSLHFNKYCYLNESSHHYPIHDLRVWNNCLSTNDETNVSSINLCLSWQQMPAR